MRIFMGVDVGSSKTHALVCDESGKCLGFGKAQGGNHQVVGYEGLEAALQAACKPALMMAGVEAGQVAGAGFGVSGMDFLSDWEAHLRAIGALGLVGPVEVVNDGVLGLLAGATGGIGVNVTAGSSNNCRGRGKDGREGRIVGNGAPFGEFGGAAEIVGRAVQMVNHAWIRRGEPTRLTQVLLEACGAKDELDLMEGLSNDVYHLAPYLAREVSVAAREGDVVAQEILRWAGEELGWLAVAVTRQIGMEDEAVEVIQSGSVFDAGEWLTGAMAEVVGRHCPRAILKRLDGPPVVGGVLLGMEVAGWDGYGVRGEMVRSAKRLVGG